jgi:hypothetical protein
MSGEDPRILFYRAHERGENRVTYDRHAIAEGKVGKGESAVALLTSEHGSYRQKLCPGYDNKRHF